MLTIKLVTYDKSETAIPTSVKFLALHAAKEVYLEYEMDGRAVLRFNGDSVTVGELRHDTAYHVAYIMNEAGKTVETIR